MFVCLSIDAQAESFHYKIASNASKSIWVAVSFVDLSWEIKPGICFLAFLRERAQSGIDVRLLFWKRVGENPLFVNSFIGSAQQQDWLRTMGYECLKIRWDPSPDSRHCHHEKTWIIDAGIVRYSLKYQVIICVIDYQKGQGSNIYRGHGTHTL